MDDSFAQFAAMGTGSVSISQRGSCVPESDVGDLPRRLSEAETYAEAGLVAGQDVQAENAVGSTECKCLPFAANKAGSPK